MALLIMLHVLGVTIWVGGMFFAYFALRPVAASQLEPPARLTLWNGVFKNFFFWVWVSVAAILVTGLMMLFKHFGGMAGAPLYVHAMFGLGLLMMAIYGHVYFAGYGKLKRAVAAEDWPAGGKALSQIRVLVLINTCIGLVTIALATGGKYLIPG